jgi:hypothetical protein
MRGKYHPAIDRLNTIRRPAEISRTLAHSCSGRRPMLPAANRGTGRVRRAIRASEQLRGSQARDAAKVLEPGLGAPPDRSAPLPGPPVSVGNATLKA